MTEKAAQRRLRRMQQAAFKAAPRLADTYVTGGRLVQRGQEAAQRRDTHAGTKMCPRHVFLASLVPCSSLGSFFQKQNPIQQVGVLFL